MFLFAHAISLSDQMSTPGVNESARWIDLPDCGPNIGWAVL